MAAEDTEIVTDLNRRLAERQADFREPKGSVGERSELTIQQILAWADAHHAAHGVWPEVRVLAGLGPIDGVPEESWKAINYALALGGRGLPGDSSLAELLAEHRGTPLPDMGPRALAERIWAWEQEQFPLRGPRRRRTGPQICPPLTISTIVAWAEAHHTATGDWPTIQSGRVRDAPFDVTWAIINSALYQGHRGLPGGSSLARLLAEHRDQLLRLIQRGGNVPPDVSRMLTKKRDSGNRRREEALTIDAILSWADAHHAATGQWPAAQSGPVLSFPGRLSWSTINVLLSVGSRGLPGRSSLARLLAEHRGVGNLVTKPLLSVDQILEWADAHHASHAVWPRETSRAVEGAPGESWPAIASALRRGSRGLPGGTSLSRLIAEHRDPAAHHRPSGLTIEQILAWADAHHAANGAWPSVASGAVAAAPGETWRNIDNALNRGHRGLPKGSTLNRLLALHRGVPNKTALPRPTLDQILAWADAHLATHGRWPHCHSGPIDGEPRRTWSAINSALAKGLGDFRPGLSLAKILEEHRGRPRSRMKDLLNLDRVLAWADAHFAANGAWPRTSSGPVAAAPGETWKAIDSALSRGHRGLPGGMSLVRILHEHRGVRSATQLPDLTLDQILAWADAHHAAHGRWPTAVAVPVAGAPSGTWSGIDSALSQGHRGLPGGTTLARVLHEHRQTPRRDCLRDVTLDQILAWADAHLAAHGRWPTAASGPIAGAFGGTWSGINAALSKGLGDLPSGLSVARVLEQYRGRSKASVRALALEEILIWADAYFAAHGRWPNPRSGAVAAAPDVTWRIIDLALAKGSRGLPGGTTLFQLLARERPSTRR